MINLSHEDSSTHDQNQVGYEDDHDVDVDVDADGVSDDGLRPTQTQMELLRIIPVDHLRRPTPCTSSNRAATNYAVTRIFGFVYQYGGGDEATSSYPSPFPLPQGQEQEVDELKRASKRATIDTDLTALPLACVYIYFCVSRCFDLGPPHRKSRCEWRQARCHVLVHPRVPPPSQGRPTWPETVPTAPAMRPPAPGPTTPTLSAVPTTPATKTPPITLTPPPPNTRAGRGDRTTAATCPTTSTVHEILGYDAEEPALGRDGSAACAFASAVFSF
ncbi:hypothetical protein GALMADRAFT_1294958 [Galerina marginata CBS 339.88]|uniref:Uncharacterized protein n=1 Tax=Galerina marginata (strain CBS 339.88) TaxID=685588 RepID=A0A067T4C8_GALM3|nr:hypothetical protein GALMADRAFT_1294958 [Galerina marginata CBS 339.88]